ncbi:MAG: efflux RND transporter periplasmic adaptor subunit, partial [Planctomycetota bacterium]|nr:efflux RND transporter periplasmic adaptor subunit [Planctomycetota bacterium]
KMGQKVRKGDALVDLFSTELAAAKTDLQVSYVQWRHDLRLYNVRVDLEKTKAIARQVLVDTANDLMKSRLAYTTALGKLKIFEVPDEDVDVLLVDLGDEKISEEKFGKIADKARMTLRAPADGIVITREVVPGNYYESGSLLMTTAPLDHLWVWVNLYEIDQDKVRLGQIMEIDFPFLDDKIRGKVEYIANEVAKDTRAVRVRASIPNLDGRLKSDMVVRAFLEIPPLEGQTVIPRKSVIALNGEEYVFVQSEKNANKFERKQIRVAQEKSDFVVVASGLKAGQVVATMGALILAQMYEDEGMIETGLPTQ